MGNPLPPPTVLTALAIGPNLESSVRVIPPSDSPIAGTTYTLVLDDDGLWKRTTNSSAVTVTVPPHSAVPIPVNSSILISQGGSGAVTVAAGAGVTLNSSGGTLVTSSEFEVIRLFQNTLDNWTLTITGTGSSGGGNVPTGGTTNQVLAKASNTNFDTAWVNAGGGGGNTFTLTASGAIAAGTAVSVNSSGAGVNAWGPAPNIAGVVNAIPGSIGAGPSSATVTMLSSASFVAWVYSEGSPTVASLVAGSISGNTVTVGTPDQGLIPTIASILPLTASTFVAFDGAGNAYAGSVSALVITLGAPAAVPNASGQPPDAAAMLTTTTFVVSAGGNAVIGTISAGAITFGTPVQIGSGTMAFPTSVIEVLSSTVFAVVYPDGGNSNNLTVVAAAVTLGDTITFGTPNALSSAVSIKLNSAFSQPLVLSSTSFAVGWLNSAVQFSAVIVSLSTLVVSFGSPIVLSNFAIGPTLPSVTTLYFSAAVLDSTHVAFGAGGTLPQICTISGDAISAPTALSLKNNAVLSPFAISSANAGDLTPAAINSVVPLTSMIMVADGASQIYEVDGSSNVSPVIQHADTFGYGLSPIDGTHALAWFFDYDNNFNVRVITAKPINSAPIGLTAAGASDTNPVTVQNSGLLTGLSGLTPGAQYYSNGDGTLTTGNTGHPVGTAVSATTMAVNIQNAA